MPTCSAIVRNTSPWLRTFDAALIFAGFGAVPFVARPTVLFFFAAFLAIPLPPSSIALAGVRTPVACLGAGSTDACVFRLGRPGKPPYDRGTPCGLPGRYN